MKSILFILSMVVSIAAVSQDGGFNQGSIVTMNNDTLPGLVKNVVQVPYHILPNVKFKKAKKDETKTFEPGELKAYETQGQWFISKEYKKGKSVEMLFVQVISTGYLSYYVQTESSMGANPGGGTGVSTRGTDYLQREGEQSLTRIGGKKQLLEYLSDAPGVCKQIEDGTLKKKDLDKVVEAYNLEKKK
jgi:hypothetical protein